MSYLLHLDSSADTLSSASRRLSADFAKAWVDAQPGREVRYRDLHADRLPHLSTNALHFTPDRRPADAVPPSAADQQLQDELIAELTGAAAVVIGAPMYNFGVPSTLKAWLDYVHVIGATSPAPEGIAPLTGTRVAVISARATPTGADQRADFVLGPLYTILGTFMGMDVTGFVVHTDGPNAPDDFHRPAELVGPEITACARSWA